MMSFGKRNLMIVEGGRGGGGGGRSGSAHIHMGAAATCRRGMCPGATTMGVEVEVLAALYC